jgi:molybdopterin converting factor small subunit
MVNATLTLQDLAPDPREEFSRLLRFVGWCERDRRAASRSVEPLFARGPELVADVYDHLARVPETATILGWQNGPDPVHAEERRRFLTLWLARTLGLDTSDEFALVLFRAGMVHAGLGPRRIHVPPGYVTGAMGLVLGAFARYLGESGMPGEVIAPAMSAWSRYLSVQLHLLQLGYQAALRLTEGPLAVRCAAYGRLRSYFGGRVVAVAASPGEQVRDVLRTLFNAYPEVRAEILDRVWDGGGLPDGRPEQVVPTYVPRAGWRVLLNGRDLRYAGGLQVPVAAGDEVALFPPGR